MPKLLIYADNTGWHARVSESDVDYDFVGATPELQADSVAALRAAMAVDRAAVDAAAQAVFRGVSNDADATEAVDGLFSTTEFWYGEESVYEVTEAGETLLDVLADVAAAWTL